MQTIHQTALYRYSGILQMKERKKERKIYVSSNATGILIKV
jgi:hypothetical protein